jgi:hypothetical protein
MRSRPAAAAGKKIYIYLLCILISKTLRELTRVLKKENKSAAAGWKSYRIDGL